MTRGSSRTLFAGAAVILLFPAAVKAQTKGPDDKEVAKAAQDLREREVEVGNLEASVAMASQTVRNLAAEIRYFPIERRLLDADLLFETGSYDQAAILYRDLIENDAFRSQPGYYLAMFKLAESLFKTRNYVSARQYFQRAAVPGAGPNFVVAVSRLFDIAVVTKDFSGCDHLESLVASFAESTPDLLYSYGKYLFHRGRMSDAEQTFARIPPEAASFSRARYFLGVMASKTGRFDAALEHFTVAASQPPKNPGDEDVLGLAHLARSRVLVSIKRYEEALAALQAVPVTSSVYPEALYDTAWIGFLRGDMMPAAHALDILLLTQPTGDLALRASALRGRILTRLQDPESAQEAYEEISANLTPLAKDLDRMAQNPRGLQTYFDWVMATQAEKLRLEPPVSDRTARWLESDPDMSAITEMFRDLSRERNDLQEGIEIADRLLWALRSKGRIVSFPVLKERLLRLEQSANSFLAAAVAALDGAANVFAGRIPGEEGARYDNAVRARRAAARDLERIPRSYEAFLDRERQAISDYREVERQLFLVGSVLEMQQRQVIAIEDWLRDAKARGDQRLTEARESEIRAAVSEEKRNLDAIRSELSRLREVLERERLMAESQVEMLSADDALRRELWRVVIEEARVLEATTAGLGSDLARIGRETAALVRRASVGAESIEPIVQEIYEIAARGARELETAVAQEREQLSIALAALERLRLDFEVFARTEGSEVFRRISARLRAVLLEADLGLVDMAWERERRLSEALRKMSQERAEKVQSLGRIEGMVRSASPPAQTK